MDMNLLLGWLANKEGWHPRNSSASAVAFALPSVMTLGCGVAEILGFLNSGNPDEDPLLIRAAMVGAVVVLLLLVLVRRAGVAEAMRRHAIWAGFPEAAAVVLWSDRDDAIEWWSLVACAASLALGAVLLIRLAPAVLLQPDLPPLFAVLPVVLLAAPPVLALVAVWKTRRWNRFSSWLVLWEAPVMPGTNLKGTLYLPFRTQPRRLKLAAVHDGCDDPDPEGGTTTRSEYWQSELGQNDIARMQIDDVRWLAPGGGKLVSGGVLKVAANPQIQAPEGKWIAEKYWLEVTAETERKTRLSFPLPVHGASYCAGLGEWRADPENARTRCRIRPRCRIVSTTSVFPG